MLIRKRVYIVLNVVNKKCKNKTCDKIPSFNFPTEKISIYCFEHKKNGMIDVHNNTCQEKSCSNIPLYGLKNTKKRQFCTNHKKDGMINLILENKCSVPECQDEYEFIVDGDKLCSTHSPDNYKINVKRLCKYCDIKEESKYICKRCQQISNKKEWGIVRYLRTAINTPFIYNSSKMLQGCSKKRPDVYFELNKHCVIVEIDEYQHKTYEDSCECSRINEIVNGIGGKSIIIIRFNPDITKNKNKKLDLKLSDKIDLLVSTIKKELIKDYDKFQVKLIQLYYDDNYTKYKRIKTENITDKVSI